MSSSPALEEKIALFAEWELFDVSEDDAEDGSRSTSYRQPQSDEQEHRRRSKEFAAAAAKKRKATILIEDDEGKTEDPVAETQKERTKESSRTGSKVAAGEAKGDQRDSVNSSSPALSRPARRSLSAAVPAATSRQVEPVRSTALRRTTSNPLPAASSKGETRPSKRKRTSDSPQVQARKGAKSKDNTDDDGVPALPAVPEPRRVFRGLAFYYIPDAALGARKLRIAKARQYGARWVRRLHEATHVVVDKKLSWSDIQVVLHDSSAEQEGQQQEQQQRQQLPPTLVFVTEEYPLDCISFRYLLNPDQRRYRIPGRPVEQPSNVAPSDAAMNKPAVGDQGRDANKKNNINAYAIKPDLRQQRRLGTPATAGNKERELFVKKPRTDG